MTQYPHELSGGQCQRVMIAMALACDPELLIADEPTTALDVTIQAQILDLMRGLREQIQTAIILITHDLGVVAEMADRIAVMYAGRIVEEGPAATLLRAPRHPYTLALLRGRAHGHLEPGARLETIPGAPPDLARLPAGCAFADRCRLVQDACRQQPPEVGELAPGHRVRCFRTDATAPDALAPSSATPPAALAA
jgi:peptide/nickel transport system ATP-binding protein